MAKDPAFLFYYQDFLVGTDDFKNEEVGAYIRCLCIQAAKGGISENHMKKICESPQIQNVIKKKFIWYQDEGVFRNDRLSEEIEKRRKYCESRSNNKKGKKHIKITSKSYDQHMEDEDENEIEDESVLNTGVVGDDLKNEKKNNMSKKSDTKDIPLPFVEKEFVEIWAEWLRYRSERRLAAYTPTGLKRTLNRLLKDCGGHCDVAVEMIDFAISKTWQGIFPINTEKNGTTNIPASASSNKTNGTSTSRIEALKKW